MKIDESTGKSWPIVLIQTDLSKRIFLARAAWSERMEAIDGSEGEHARYAQAQKRSVPIFCG